MPQHSAEKAPNFITDPVLAGKQIKPLVGAVIVLVKDPGHDKNGANRKIPQNMHNVIPIQKHINDPRNDNQKHTG